MDALKSFFKKKKVDKKFRNAGTGHSLITPRQGGPSNDQSPNRRVDANTLAIAAQKRIQKPNEELTYSQKRLQMQAKRELEEERRKVESQTKSLQIQDQSDQVKSLPQGQLSVLYTCDIFDSSIALPKHMMIEAIEECLRNMLNEKEESIEAAVHMIHTVNKKQPALQAIDTLKKYLTNILSDPGELKFRRIRTSNKIFVDKVASVKGCTEFLQSVGFVESEETNQETNEKEKYLLLEKVDISEMEAALEALNEGEPIPIKLSRNLQVYIVDPKKPVPRPDIPPEFFSRSVDELKREQQARTDEIERLTTLRLRTSKTDPKKCNYKYTLIRVRFPNNYILQGIFNVNENFQSVYSFVSEQLETQCGTYNLNFGAQSFDQNASFLDSDLVPSALLSFSWDEETMNQFSAFKQPTTYLKKSLQDEAIPLN